MWMSMTTYNRHDYTIRTLESLAKTDFPEDSHLVIRDDVSNDQRVVQYLKEYAERKINNLDIELIVNTKQLGCDPNMITGLLYCVNKTKDQFVITLDNDTVFNPKWLKKLIEVRDILLNDNQSIGAITVFNTLSGRDNHKFIKRYNDEIGIKNDIGGFSAMINRRLFEEYDFMNPKWNMGWDWNMCFKLKEMGMKIFCTHQSYVEHIGVVGVHSDGSKGHCGDVAINFVGE